MKKFPNLSIEVPTNVEMNSEECSNPKYIESQIEKISLKINNLQMELTNEQERNRKLQEDNVLKRKKKALTLQKLDQLEILHNEARKEIVDFKWKHCNETIENQRLKSRNEELREELSQLNQRISKLEKENKEEENDINDEENGEVLNRSHSDSGNIMKKHTINRGLDKLELMKRSLEMLEELKNIRNNLETTKKMSKRFFKESIRELRKTEIQVSVMMKTNPNRQDDDLYQAQIQLRAISDFGLFEFYEGGKDGLPQRNQTGMCFPQKKGLVEVMEINKKKKKKKSGFFSFSSSSSSKRKFKKYFMVICYCFGTISLFEHKTSKKVSKRYSLQQVDCRTMKNERMFTLDLPIGISVVFRFKDIQEKDNWIDFLKNLFKIYRGN